MASWRDAPVEELEVGVRIANVLKKMDIKTLGELVLHPAHYFLEQENFGRKSLYELEAVLGDEGFRLGMEPGEEPAETGKYGSDTWWGRPYVARPQIPAPGGTIQIWVAVIKSDQFVHKVVGPFLSEDKAKAWTKAQSDPLDWDICKFTFV